MNFFIFAIFCSIAASVFAQDTIQPGGKLELWNILRSPDKRFDLGMDKSGDLVLWDNLASYKEPPAWVSGTSGSGAIRAIMQTDGQFVMQTASGETVWSTYTRDAGSVVKLQDDGNLVVFSPNGYPVWSAKTGYGKKTTV